MSEKLVGTDDLDAKPVRRTFTPEFKARILAEYDALPELSQEISPDRKPATGRSAGHGCGHCALGTAAVGWLGTQ